jgi:arylsulfatase A-like enzyme
MNDVLQADDFFRQTFDLVRDDYEHGRTVFLATSDHGEEIRDHGVFGHASATFWNEKVVVPFMLGLPGASLSRETRAPILTSHVDVWPTLFDYLGASPTLVSSKYSDGESLLPASRFARPVYVAGRFFPYADRPSVLVDGSRKYWFRVSGMGKDSRLCTVVTRVTDLEDHALPLDRMRLDPDTIPAFDQLQRNFWRFLVPVKAKTETQCPRR